MSHYENFINKSVGVTKSSKFQALRMQLLVTAISTQIFSENTMILQALHYVKKFLYLDPSYPGVCWVVGSAAVCSPSLYWACLTKHGLENYGLQKKILSFHFISIK